MKKKFYTIREAEKIASAKTRKGTFIWAQSGSEDDYTTNKNIADLNSIKIYPRVLKKIIKADTTVSFLNNKFESPLVLSPMGHQTQFHKRGEIETTIGLKNIPSDRTSDSIFNIASKFEIDLGKSIDINKTASDLDFEVKSLNLSLIHI